MRWAQAGTGGLVDTGATVDLDLPAQCFTGVSYRPFENMIVEIGGKWEGWSSYKDLTIKDILTKQNDRIIYEYDFGDGWKHEIWLEKIVPTGKKEHPVCLKGRMKCPPEDCGGVWGYMDLLEELSKLDGAERKLYLEDRFMDDFDPEHFDKDEINQQLKEWKAVWMNKWE
jgi:hypothetical protein